jgi:hypothetical protein
MTKKQINLQTSRIPWHELQRFFAAGFSIFVNSELDLVEVAFQFSQDNKTQVEQWLKQEKIGPVSDPQALKWYEENITVWAVVIKPWVLVQEKTHER